MKIVTGHKLIRLFLAISLFFSAAGLFAAPAGGKFDFNYVLSHHLNDAVVFEWQIGGTKVRPGDERFEKDPYKRYLFRDDEGVYKWDGGVPMHITKRVMMIFIACILMLTIFISAARIIAGNPHRINGRFANAVESLVQFIRVDVVGSMMHGHGRGFEPYILTLFFFILFGNLLGLVPPLGEVVEVATIIATGGEFGHDSQPGDTVHLPVGFWPGITYTGDIGVTLPLAAITAVMIWVTGFRYQGVSFLWSFLPGGIPKPVVPVLFVILFVLEIIVSPLAKGFALMMRLLANMTAGHVILLAIICFIFQFASWGVVFIAVPGTMAIYFLEIFVGFLQAFLFALLTTVFIAGAMHAH